MEKRCSKCGSTGPFYRHRSTSDGLTSRCVACSKQTHQDWKSKNPGKASESTARWKKANPERVLQNKLAWARANPDKVNAIRVKSKLRRYGMSGVTWQALFDLQEGACAICELPMVPSGRGANSAVVDHDHITGRVRGLLHSRCNLAIGYMDEDPAQLRRAAEYLEYSHALPHLCPDVTDRSGSINGPGSGT